MGILYYQFIAISTEILIKRYAFTLLEAKNLMAIFSMETAFFTAAFGLLFNYTPGRVIWIFISSVLALIAYITLLYLPPRCGAWIHLPLALSPFSCPPPRSASPP